MLSHQHYGLNQFARIQKEQASTLDFSAAVQSLEQINQIELR